MTPKQVKDIFDKLPPKRRKVLVGFLAGHSRAKIMIDADIPSDAALTGHLKELYKNFRINTGWNDADDRRSGTRKLPLLISLFARSMPELISARIPEVPDEVEQEETITKSHQKLVEPVKALASKLSFQQKVDYTRLQNLLTDEKWRENDKETLTVMLKVVGREQEGWLTTEHIENFPCPDLQTIDQLWKKYSNERFGLSIQKRIWESVGGTPDADYRTVCYFGNHVGWRRSGRWLSYGNRTFNHLSPKGHLPYLCFQIKLPDLNLLEFAELFNFEQGLERVRDFGVNRLFNLAQKCKL